MTLELEIRNYNDNIIKNNNFPLNEILIYVMGSIPTNGVLFNVIWECFKWFKSIIYSTLIFQNLSIVV